MRKFLAMILAISMVMGLTCVMTVSSFAAEAKKVLEGEKSATHIDADRYDISVKVPGGDGEIRHDDVVLMVDGSYSGDDEWPDMKEAINAIGTAVLNGNGNTQLTLMAFGMGDNYVLEHIVDADDLAAALGELPGNLLRGVSSTNCESGFTGVAEFVESHEASLKDAIVIFISDGGINTDETPRLFYNWTDYTPNINNVISYALDGVELPAGTTQEEKIALVNNIWKEVFELSGMDINGEYPISEMERAFLVYAEDPANTNGWSVYYSFLVAMKGSAFDKYPNVWSRTYNSVFDLAKVEKVKDLYLVRYTDDSRATWMPEAAAVSADDNIHYVKSDSISTLTSALEGTLTDLANTPYNNVVVTDYMSKWVNLIPETIKVVDANGLTVAEFDAENSLKDASGKYTSYAFKWVGTPLCASKAPIILDLISESDYAAGGSEVVGNSSGVIYRITWNIKDGPLYRNDAYELKYEVTVDYEEPGLKFDTDIPTNGNTEIKYEDENGEDIEVPIIVPNIIVDKIDSIYGTLSGIKYLDGDPARRFTFALEYNGNVIETVQSDEDGIFRFTQPSFEEAGEYVYKIYETDLTNSRIIYDDSVYEVTYIVTRTADQLDSEFHVTKNGEAYEGAIAFYNETISPITVFINGSKNLIGGEISNGEFEFILTDTYSGETYTATNDDNGDFCFTLELDDGYYQFTLTEADGGRDDIIYDTAEYNITVQVERGEDGHYNASVSYKGFERIVFTNEVVVEETTEPEVTEPEETTEVPEETTEAPEETTEAPEETTEAPEETTEVPEETTEAPEETAEVPEVTTEPEEEITEEPTPLDPAPETTEPEEEITDPEVPLDPNPKTGDSTVIIVIAAIAALSLAVIYFKRRQTTEE